MPTPLPVDPRHDPTDPSPPDPEALLLRYARTRDPKTREALIHRHQPLVRFIAARFVEVQEPLDDLVQVGTIGLIKAIDGFDPARQVRFSAYAMPTILGEIKRHFRDRGWHVKVPRWLQERALSARRAEQALTQRLGRAPSVREVGRELGLSDEEILEALGLHALVRTVSLDDELDAYGGARGGTMADVIGQIDTALRDVDAHTDLRRALEQLEDREAEVVRLRFFEELSQSAIARRLGVPQMRVSRLERRALERLRVLLTAAGPSPRTGQS